MSALASRRSRVFLFVALTALSAVVRAQQEEPSKTFSLDCESLALDLKSNTSVCKMVEVSNGEIQISADEGTANETNFESSVWQLAGNVEISLESTVMRAASARFEFSNNELVYGELVGAPVEMSDFIAEQDTEVRGSAEQIVYDGRSGSAQMLGQAELVLGANEYLGCDLVYNLNDKTFNSGSSDCGVRVRIFPRDNDAGAPSEQP